MRIVFSLLILLLWCYTIFHPCLSYAQKAKVEYPYKHYTIQDGLAQMQVQALFQDKKGYLWCGTKIGVSRFDGHNFKNYTNLDINQQGPVEFFIEDKDSNFLIFNRTNFSRITADSVISHPYPKGFQLFEGTIYPNSPPIVSLLKNKNGPWDKISLLNYANPDSAFITQIEHNHNGILYYDSKNINHVWFRNHDSIYIMDVITKTKIKSFEKRGISAICYLDDTLYGFSPKYGIFKLSEDKFERVSDEKIDGFDVKIIASPNDEYLVIKTDKNLYYYKDKLTVIKKDFTLIRDILFDNEGNLWVATEEGLYNFFQLNFVNYTFGMGNKDWVWTILEDNEKNMWFSSFQNGIWKWDGNNITEYTTQINEMRKYKYNIARYCTYFMGGSKFGKSLYFTTNNSVIEYRNGKFARIKGIPNIQNKAYFFTKTFDDSTFYCGGMPGLFELNPNKKNRQWTDKDLGISTILSIERSRDKSLITIGSNGIAEITNDSIIYIQKPSDRNNFCSTKDHLENIWIGGNQKLELLTGDTIKSIVPNSTEQYFSLLFVKPHYLLIGGLKGLYVVNLNNYYQNNIFEPILYNQHNGFTGIECGQNGFFTDSEGMVWINTSDLVTRFNPKKLINQSPAHPRLFISALNSSDNVNWHTTNIETKQLFKHEENNFRFQFNTISFSNAENIRYYHQLEGLQSGWSEASGTNEINFYNLQPGKYTLLVKADSGIRLSVSEIESYSFEIEKPYWQTWWFILCVILLLFALIFLTIFLFIKKTRKQELIKKRILQLRADALKSQMNPHLIYNALNNINGLINLGEKRRAQEYLNAFSDVLRLVFASTNKHEISLNDELEIVKSFIHFHKQANAKNFDYKITSELTIDMANILIPPVLIQPFVENAILHGFSRLNGKQGFIKINTRNVDNRLIVSIEDNGIGMGKSEYKGNGRGTTITHERMQLLEKKPDNQVKIINLDQGTRVVINIPLKLLK